MASVELSSSATKSGTGYGPGEAPRWSTYSKCVHCGLCLNACPTYRELGLEMDSPRGRIFQMVQVAEGAPIGDSYREHIESHTVRPWRSRMVRSLVFKHLLQSPALMTLAGSMVYMYQASGMQRL